MGKSKIWRVFSKIILIISAVIMVNLLMDLGDSKSIIKSYDSVKPDSTSGLNKSLQFIEGYTRLTGDTTFALGMGYDSSIINSWTNSGSNDIDNTNVTGTTTSYDITDIVKAICLSYTSGLSSNADCYVAGSGAYAKTKYGTVTYNSRVLKPYSSGDVYNRCCNGLVSGILFLCGVKNYNNGSNINENYPYISCDNIWSKIGSQMQPTTFGELKVGDILCIYRKGNPDDICHVETVVKVENGNVYIASAGSSNGIWSCASQGYNRVKPVSSSLSDFYNSSTSSSWGGVKGVVRP